MIAQKFGPDAFIVIVILLFAFVGFGLSVWALVDAATRPDQAWVASGQSKVLWIVLVVGLTLLTPFGFILAIVYLTVIRKQVQAAQFAGSPQSNTSGGVSAFCRSCGSSLGVLGGSFCPVCGTAQ